MSDSPEDRKARHTPGPWRAEADQVFHDGDRPLAQVYGQYPTYEANARLIAAAPEMLEALKAVIGTEAIEEFHAHGRAMDEAMNKARTAIAKAEGE